jgi:hypothetical protein
MANRFCPTCRSDVEDAGGFCLLGHPLALSAPTAPLAELRADVDRAFEEAQARVDEVLAAAPVNGAGRRAPGPPPRPPAAASIATKTVPMPSVAEAPSRPPAPEAPPRPPAPAVYSSLDEPLAHGDPIAAFAPAPRMDWGPERSLLRRLPERISDSLDV